jgi:hypothetical protein
VQYIEARGNSGRALRLNSNRLAAPSQQNATRAFNLWQDRSA